ncbi:MAG: response regulator transcription factor [Planctomycetota bacterium]|nr:MAG: response regulator transcription factor [Planctomycetota bacterium]
MAERILVVEDDRAIVLGIEKNLRFEGFEVLVATDGEKGLSIAIDKQPDLIILDIMLPKMNGYEVCKTLRKHEIDIPIIFLSAKNQTIDKVMGLDLGGDDYISKPFRIDELLARVNATLRRKRLAARKLGSLEFGNVKLDVGGRVLRVKGKEVELSTREFMLLKYLAENEGVVLDRQSILNKVWGYDYYGTSRTIDNFVTKLRQKIEDDPENPRHLMTIRGVGYKFLLEPIGKKKPAAGKKAAPTRKPVPKSQSSKRKSQPSGRRSTGKSRRKPRSS